MKTVHPFAAREWGKEESDEIPIHYAAQVMHGLMVKPRRRAVVAALVGADDLRVRWIARDDETIAGIRAKEIEFWRRVQERDPPDPESLDDVKWLYARDGGIVMEADDELHSHVTHLAGIKAELKRLDSAAEATATRIKLAMGHASTLIYRGQKICTWKSNKESTKTDWKQAFDILQRDTQASEEQILNSILMATTTAPGNRPLLIK